MKNQFLLAVSITLMACNKVPTTMEGLTFDPSIHTGKTLEMPNGENITYDAYENIFFVTNVEDSTYQTLNFYVPQGANEKVPIFLRTYVGGYMAAKAREPQADDATGRALQEGYVVCIPGSRGWNSKVGNTFTGRAPADVLDLKAAIRYLRHNDATMPGDAERIITDGTSAGGAMSSLLGSSGNSPMYEPYLKAMGAAPERDDVFASVCYCPIIDLEHADMTYEWLYACTNTGIRNLSSEQIQVSDELKELFPAYLNNLNLKKADGTILTINNYTEYMKSYLIASAQKALDEGYPMPDTIGIIRKGQTITDIDLPVYLSYVVSTRRLKTPPSFDAQEVLGNYPTPENKLFGDETGNSVNFTPYSCSKTGKTIDESLQARIDMMNPMYHLDQTTDKAKHWYIRHGARDRDTAFPIPINFATKLMNQGYVVDFALPWNREHEGDYNLNDLFEWIHNLK